MLFDNILLTAELFFFFNQGQSSETLPLPYQLSLSHIQNPLVTSQQYSQHLHQE